MLISGIIVSVCSVFCLIHYFFFPFTIFGLRNMFIYLINGVASKWSVPLAILGLIYGVSCIICSIKGKNFGDIKTDNMHWAMLAWYVIVTILCII